MEHIRETLAKSQLVPSQTLNEKTCVECGKPAKFPYARCAECLEKESQARHEKERVEAEKRLKEVIESQQDLWETVSNIPGKFLEKTFDDFNSKLQPKAFEAVKNLQWHWDDVAEIPPKSLVLLSPSVYGVGKTHLVCALVNHIIATKEKAWLDKNLIIRKRKCPVYFISENELLRRIRDTYNRNIKQDKWGDELRQETEEDVYKSLKQFDLLIIDDVGKVRPRDLNFLQGVYFNIIDQHYNDSQPIILTTNLDLAELEEHIGGACADRLREMAGKNGFVKMPGKSYRQQ